ncbi:matrixin family metalloprotease [Streptomyces flavidovirens]|uniref:matrixin family metalloprotease n=1 Tax=Streptomyces flavidovirens TaxID=67298 RepID=UPI0034310229
MLKRILLCFWMGMSALLATVQPASAHELGFSAVDNGEIRWWEYTRYDTEIAHAHSTWDALGHINIAKDGLLTVEDLEWNDADRCDVTWVGLYDYDLVFADEVYLNVCNFNKYDYDLFKRKGTAAHELGHALGIAHSYEGQLMYKCSACSGVNTPQSHDIADYNDLWG